METRALLEAILFVADEALPTEDLAGLLELPKVTMRKELESFSHDLAEDHRGLVLREVGAGWRLYTHPDAKPYLEQFAASVRARKLSKASLETLAVVAYRQPVSRAQVAEIRGVDSETALQTLERHGLIEESGRAPGPGQAVLYATSGLFLEKMGIRSPDELPPLADHVPPSNVVEALERPFRTGEPSNDSTS